MPDRLPNAEEPPLGLEHDVHDDVRLGCADLPELHFYNHPPCCDHGGYQAERQQRAQDLSEQLPDNRLDD